ncbi:hypothetical protein EB73_10670 [Mycobacterium sp. SWH-M3]|nr:hypothetical protein EB73_10670 [Mycobacterium sp. SWH-M3]
MAFLGFRAAEAGPRYRQEQAFLGCLAVAEHFRSRVEGVCLGFLAGAAFLGCPPAAVLLVSRPEPEDPMHDCLRRPEPVRWRPGPELPPEPESGREQQALVMQVPPPPEQAAYARVRVRS